MRKDAFEDVKFPELSRVVKYFKETEGSFGEMCKTVEDYAKDYAEEREKKVVKRRDRMQSVKCSKKDLVVK